jgi:hypothetical protein
VARVGPPVRFPAGIALPDATHQLREAVKALMR